MKIDIPVIVHSHLRWDFVWQRPQQILSRMSHANHVLFVEEPIYVDDQGTPQLIITQPMTQVYRAVPMLPAALREHYDRSIDVTRELIRREIGANGKLAGLFEKPVQWFYTPMAAPAMIGAFNDSAIVYDCMDELSQFRFAPKELIDRERLLLSEADVVFTGGYKLSQSKARHNSNVQFFGCGVDVEHFAQATADATEVAEAIRGLGPRVAGYYGVIDERIDYALIARLAEAMPDVAIAMVGPVVKVAQDELPKAPNIHWLGQRDYGDLPSIVKGFSVCLMPFALNEATEYINPTKTLEYMAASKPIVSTAVSDVVRNFTPVVAVARTYEEFCQHVQRGLDAPDLAMVERGVEQASQNTWESIVAQMERTVREAVTTRVERAQHATRSVSAHRPQREAMPQQAFMASREKTG